MSRPSEGRSDNEHGGFTVVDGTRTEGDLRHGWQVYRGVDCVECPDCGFLFAACHEDVTAPNNYTCPNCPPPASVEATPPAGRTIYGPCNYTGKFSAGPSVPGDAERDWPAIAAPLRAPTPEETPVTGEATPEQAARDILDRMGFDGEGFTAGDVVEIANLIAENRRLRSLSGDTEKGDTP